MGDGSSPRNFSPVKEIDSSWGFPIAPNTPLVLLRPRAPGVRRGHPSAQPARRPARGPRGGRTYRGSFKRCARGRSLASRLRSARIAAAAGSLFSRAAPEARSPPPSPPARWTAADGGASATGSQKCQFAHSSPPPPAPGPAPAPARESVGFGEPPQMLLALHRSPCLPFPDSVRSLLSPHLKGISHDCN